MPFDLLLGAPFQDLVRGHDLRALARASIRIGGPGADRLAARFAFTDGQPFLAVEPVDAVDARRLALAPEQDEQPSVRFRRI